MPDNHYHHYLEGNRCFAINQEAAQKELLYPSDLFRDSASKSIPCNRIEPN